MLKLLPHQLDVLSKTEGSNKVAYYLDMGLGKTFVGGEKLNTYNNPYNLLICQKSKIKDWHEHFKKYYNYEVIVYDKKTEIPPNSVVIINYDKVWRRPELLKLNDFTLMLDESSLIKNDKAKRTKFILKMNPTNVILLSGTPTGGKYEELWSQLRLLGWDISRDLYWKQYIDVEWYDFIPIVKGYKNVERLKKKFHEYGAVFMKTDEVISLPEQNEIIVNVENTKEYKKFDRDRIISIDSKIELVGDTTLTKLLYLRQLAGIYNKNKINKLKELMESTDDRLIIFYNFNKELEIIKKICFQMEKPISIISGGLKDLKAYDDYSNSVTAVQYQAGAMGINLQKSNKIIYYTLTLSSELFEQSKKRIHRIGQKNTCFYYYLLVDNSIEHDVLETLKQRKDFTDELFRKVDIND